MTETRTHTLKSADKLFDILEYVVEHDTSTAVEVAEGTGINRSTAHVHLRTLAKNGYLVQHDNEYQPSLRFLWNGERVRSRIPFYQEGRAEVDDLARETGELVNMAVVESDGVYLAYIAEGEKAIHNHLPGKPMPMHASAVGKAVLASFSSARLDDVLEETDLDPVTDATITDVDELKRELETIRRDGFAVDAEEGGEGIRCLAAPVTDDGDVVGAVSITGPAKRIGGEYQKTLEQRIQNLANVIEVRMKYN